MRVRSVRKQQRRTKKIKISGIISSISPKALGYHALRSQEQFPSNRKPATWLSKQLMSG